MAPLAERARRLFAIEEYHRMAETVTVFRHPADDTYTDVRIVGIDCTISPLAFLDLLIRVADLFA